MSESQDINRLEQVFDAKIGQIEHRFDSLNRELSNTKDQNERSLSHLEEKITLKMDLIKQSLMEIEKRNDSAKKDKELSIQTWAVVIAAGVFVLGIIVDFFGIKYDSSESKATSVQEKQK